MLDDEDGQTVRGNLRVASDVDKFEKDLNDLQENFKRRGRFEAM